MKTILVLLLASAAMQASSLVASQTPSLGSTLVGTLPRQEKRPLENTRTSDPLRRSEDT